jgi:hypothetical protein
LPKRSRNADGGTEVAVDLRGRVEIEELVAGPKRLFIELDLFLVRAAEDHSSKAPVANRECVDPPCSRFVIPQRGIIARRC